MSFFIFSCCCHIKWKLFSFCLFSPFSRSFRSLPSQFSICLGNGTKFIMKTEENEKERRNGEKQTISSWFNVAECVYAYVCRVWILPLCWQWNGIGHSIGLFHFSFKVYISPNKVIESPYRDNNGQNTTILSQIYCFFLSFSPPKNGKQCVVYVRLRRRRHSRRECYSLCIIR